MAWGRLLAPGRWAAVLAIAGAVVLGGCAGGNAPASVRTNADMSDVERTWYQAIVVLPPQTPDGDVTVRRMADVLADPPKPARPLTTVIYLHGCTGMGDLSILRFLAGAGFAVIAPDSMARRFRPLQCDPATGRGSFNLFVYDFRQTELAFALHQAVRVPWVDSGDLFLLGGSEGGVTAALYRGDDFRGRIVAAWTCHGAPLVAGLSAPQGEPVLSIVSAGDPWYADGVAVGQAGDCSSFMGDHPNARSMVLPAAEGHAVLASPVARQAILEFLSAWRKR
ncbi:hypothetical protein [Zavarzinia sp.]|uniref:hypothetical protein n=1 Tax=Zavarzinia sp. TaxID=2027920 RepID=UPI003569A14B